MLKSIKQKQVNNSGKTAVGALLTVPRASGSLVSTTNVVRPPVIRPHNTFIPNIPICKHCDYRQQFPLVRNVQVPKEFDWRSRTGEDGRKLLQPIRDQGECGACYAFGAVGMYGNRLAMATNGRIRVVMSPQDMVFNGNRFVRDTFENPENNMTIQNMIMQGYIVEASWYALFGCDGGLLASSVDYIVLKGTVAENDTPYVSGNNPFVGSPSNYYNDASIKRYYGKMPHGLTKGGSGGIPTEDIRFEEETQRYNVENMQLAIMTDGPILGAMNIYTDFYYYPQIEEIYSRKEYITIDRQLVPVEYQGGHAFQILGWGEKDGTKYWICENTWGPAFGYDGFFLVERGVNMCNIELDAVSVFPDLAKSGIEIQPDDAVDGGQDALPTATTGSAASRNNVIIFLVVLGVLMVAGGAVAAVFFLKRKK